MSPPARRPVYFGPGDRPLFGWFYPGSAAVGVVICNPFGDEAIRANRTLRHLAAQAAQVGLPTLRFDYDGAGDSAGHDLEPDRVGSWLASIRAAADELCKLAGIEHVCLAGLRLGATLAVAAAVPQTVGLAAIAPVTNGKPYVRELRLLRKAIDAKRNIVRQAEEDNLESAGFLLTPATQASLSALDLVKGNFAPPPRVLIIDREEMPGDGKWAQRLRDSNVRVTEARLPGYTEMMLDSHDSIPPTTLIDSTVSWLRAVADEYPGTPVATQPSAPAPIILQPETIADPVTGPAPQVPIQERALEFGTPQLFGILSSPEAAANGKAILLLNSGAVNHIGPCRLYVALARHLARSGYVVLRMDIAGIGDSAPRVGQPENVVYSRCALEDVTEAIDYLHREWGAGEVRALGLCSGAYHAFKAAVARFPLRGVVLINPLTFFWKEGMSLEYADHRIAADIGRYRRNATSPESWRKLLAGKVHLGELARVLRLHAQSWMARPLRAAARQLRIPLEDDLPTELLHAARAGIDLQFIFAATDPGVELLRSKGGSTARGLRQRGKIGEEHIPDADHTFTDLAARSSLASLVMQKLRPR
jgi:alpha/beta superfamily hydrolase